MGPAAIVLGALGQLSTLASEYESASEQRRQEILDQAEAEYRRYKTALAGLPAALSADDAAADAAAGALPPAAAPAAPAAVVQPQKPAP